MDDLRYQLDLLTAMNQKLEADEKMFRNIVENSNRAFIYIQPDLGSVKVFGRWDDFFDFRPTELSEVRKLISYIDEDYRDQLGELFFPENYNIASYSCEVALVGKKEWVEIHTFVDLDENAHVVNKCITFRNITKHHNYYDELMYMAYYDSLTGLYNRNYFITKLNDFLEKAEKEKSIVSVMLIDIDEFHKINDSLGILMGDEVIQNFGLYLKEFVDDNVIAARFDADTYAFGIYDPVGSRAVDYIYSSIKEHLGTPMTLTDGNEVILSVTCGVAEYPEAADNALQLVNSAEIVTIKAKEAKQPVKFFDTIVLNEFLSNISIESKLKEAVHKMKFFLNYQPQFYANSKKIRGVEALIRWIDDDGNFISPAVFIPIAEKNGIIVSIGDWVLEEAIRAHMEWKKKFDVNITLSINISAIQYRRPDFVSKVINIVRKYNMPTEELELEITESVLIDDSALVIEKMEALRDFGIKVSIDDFGTGYSSLSYLKGLPVDTIKIDKSFIDTVLNDNPSKVITETIISMSKKLGYEIIAEGVETKEQFDYLDSINCDMIQGYYLGKPMSEEAIEEYLLRII